MSYSFPSRRSAVMTTRGIVATSQPLAVQAGLSMLMQGGNAVDAAIATAAALNVVEPMSTGLGGDAFALVYLKKQNELKALNASGRSPYAARPDFYRSRNYKKVPEKGILSVTVPGTLDGWCTLLKSCGTMDLTTVLQPAINLAKSGFPVTEVISYAWKKNATKLDANQAAAKTYMVNGKAPEPGEVFYQPDLAKTLRNIAERGRDVFYRGDIAEEIVRCSEKYGGLLSMNDLKDHTSTWVEPVKTGYRGYDVYELPPNGQGIVALMALNILEGMDIGSMEHNSAPYIHLMIEALKLAFADAERYISDPDIESIPLQGLISKSYAESRRSLISPDRTIRSAQHGIPEIKGDTVYLAVTDAQGNSVSFINSLFEGFGSGIVVDGTGICLQNRGSLFSLEEGHPNCIAPHKRPYHTIIPAMIFKDDRLFLTFGVMGGFMQPQGHVQVLANIIDFNMDIQSAIDAPRFRYIRDENCAFESGINEDVVKKLEKIGHRRVMFDDPYSQEFGGGQAIMVHPETGALIAGSDPRKDGCAAGLW
jgi:gamma-glutamyltranspeptidase / glutathione hydrolase